MKEEKKCTTSTEICTDNIWSVVVASFDIETDVRVGVVIDDSAVDQADGDFSSFGIDGKLVGPFAVVPIEQIGDVSEIARVGVGGVNAPDDGPVFGILRHDDRIEWRLQGVENREVVVEIDDVDVYL